VGYKFGAWHDVLWLERPLQPRVVDPAVPIPLPVARNNPAFADALNTGLPLLRL
jgi:hypothetical protein